MKLKALIVDDERLARKELINLLRRFDNIEIAGEAGDSKTAIEMIKENSFDVIFLDIQMPGESGFELIEKIETSAKIIFVTAYDEFALRAFDVNALDYLLKPVNPVRLEKALERLEDTIQRNITPVKKLEYEDTIFIQVGSAMKFLKVNKIVCIFSAGDYSEVNTSDGLKGLTSKTMKEWEERLPGNSFYRIHRTSIININYVNNVDKWFEDSYQVTLKGITKPVAISRRYAAKLRQELK